jgi:hypothetical protein
MGDDDRAQYEVDKVGLVLSRIKFLNLAFSERLDEEIFLKLFSVVCWLKQ